MSRDEDLAVLARTAEMWDVRIKTDGGTDWIIAARPVRPGLFGTMFYTGRGNTIEEAGRELLKSLRGHPGPDWRDPRPDGGAS